MNIKPLFDKVVVESVTVEEKTKSGFFLPTSAQEKPQTCQVVAVGPGGIIDGKEMPSSLFKLIKKTSQENPNSLVSAYKDNVAFVKGPKAKQFAPCNPQQADYFKEKDIKTVLHCM